MNSIVSVKNVKKSYKDGDSIVEVLNGIDLEIEKGDFVSIRGESGAGKSTLLNILGSLDNYDEGEVTINNNNLNEYPAKNLHKFRKENIGFIFQHHYLLPDFTVLENVMIPLLLLDISKADAADKSEKMLDRIGLKHRISHFPSQISGGESQRVAVARAVVQQPPLVLADEPTGNLDSKNTEKFIELLCALQQEYQLTVLVVTHEISLAETADHKYHMNGGCLFSS